MTTLLQIYSNPFLLNTDEIDIHSFENQYLKPSHSNNYWGINHILIDSFLKNPEQFKNVLEKYKAIDWEKEKNNNNNSLNDVLYQHYDKIDNLIKFINNDFISDNLYHKILSDIYIKDKEKFKEAFLIRKTIDSKHFIRLFHSIIQKDDYEMYTFLFSNSTNFNDEIKKIPDIVNVQLNNNKKQLTNLLFFAIKNNSYNIINHIIDHKTLNLDGTIYVEPNIPKMEHPYKTVFPAYTRQEKRIINVGFSPIRQAFEKNDYQLFEKIFNNLDNIAISELLRKREFPIIKNNWKSEKVYNTLLEDIINHDDLSYLNFVINNIYNIYKQCDKMSDKNNLLNKLLNCDKLNLNQKVDIVSQIHEFFVDEKTENNALYSYNQLYNEPVLDKFITNCYRQINSYEEKEKVGKIIGLLYNKHDKILTNNILFAKPIWIDTHWLNILLANGIDFSLNYNEKQNPFNQYFSFKLSNNDLLDNENKIKNNLNTIKKIYQNDIMNILNINYNYRTNNFLDIALYNIDLNFLNIFTSNEIKEISKHLTQPLTHYIGEPKEEELDRFEKISKRLFIENYKFFYDEKTIYMQPFYHQMLYNRDSKFLDNVLEKEQKHLYELSNDINFWQFVKTEKVNAYIKDRANYNNIQTTIDIINKHSDIVFDLYLKNGGTTDYHNEQKDNLLHYLIKNNNKDVDGKRLDYLNKIKLLMDIKPELASQENKQNKFPISYLIKDIIYYSGYQNYPQENKKLNISKEIFSNFLNITNFNKNTKAKKFLLTQLNNPDFKSNFNVEEFVSKILEVSLTKKEITYKKNKI